MEADLNNKLPEDMICGKNTCNDEKDPNSVFCMKHRDQVKAANDKQKARNAEKIKRKIDVDLGPTGTGVEPTPGEISELKSQQRHFLPPNMTPGKVTGGSSPAIADINRAIEELQGALDTLIKTKEILSRMGA